MSGGVGGEEQDEPVLPYPDCLEISIVSREFFNFHRRFLKGKTLIIFCPKLDQVKDLYIEKLAAIFRENNITSNSIVHMEVPCCFGTGALVESALKQSGKNIMIKDYTVSLDGKII